jgi:hypothetical protein
MVPVVITVKATDNYDKKPISRIVGVASSESVNGTGDGNTSTDWQITGPLTLNLRAERSGNGPGRVYTITVETRDASGNSTRGTTTVNVPKGAGNSK